MYRLRVLDTTLLRAIAPPGNAVLSPPVDLSTATSAQHQLRLVADWSPHQLRAELETLWCGRPIATAVREVIRDGPAGARRMATALTAYWDTALAPRPRVALLRPAVSAYWRNSPSHSTVRAAISASSRAASAPGSSG
jgi:hypothetical protein